MRRLLICILAACCAWTQASVAASPESTEWPTNTFAAICFHDIQDDLLTRPDSYSVTTRSLVVYLSWLREHDYHVVTLDDVIESRRQGGRPLPPRAVLLTFDDGLVSAYTRAFPLLEAFHFPATVALVGSWLEPTAADAKVAYGDTTVLRSEFLTPDQIHEMQRSGLIEFGSHTYALHKGIIANPQQNLEPAVAAHQFNTTGVYESDQAYEQRLREDLARNNAAIEELTGKPPRVVVWPYGARSQVADQVAAESGMPYGMTLDRGLNTPDVPLNRMRRIIITHDFTPADFAERLQRLRRREPIRVMQVDLDQVFDQDPGQQEANLSTLLDRVKAFGVNTVFLQAYADPAGAGVATALYFPNRHLPMRADLFNRVAWQLRTRTGVAVYAWLPMLAYALPSSEPAHDHWITGNAAPRVGDVQRLSPFDPVVRRTIREIYADLSTSASFQGLLFSDDATLNDFEDSGAEALKTYQEWGLPANVAAIRKNPGLFRKWTQLKISYLTDFSLELTNVVRADHSDLSIARNLFARVVMDPRSEDWFGQSLTNALESYDYVALMAMPYLEEQRNRPIQWLTQLETRVAAQPDGLGKTIFELQTVDWAKGHQPVPDTTLVEQIRTLRAAGVRSLGYYPDNFIDGHPSLKLLKPELSLQAFPATR